MALIGELLLERGALQRSGLEEALRFQSQFGGLLGQALLKLGLVREDFLLNVLGEQLHLPILPRERLPDIEAVRTALSGLRLSQSFLTDHSALIWFDADRAELLNAVARNPILPALQEQLAKRFSGTVRYYLAPNRLVDSGLERLRQHGLGNGGLDGEGASLARLRQLAEEAPVIEFVNSLLVDALDSGASDVHIEPDEFGFRTRFRIDGVLGLDRQHPRQIFDAVSTRIKIVSNMDIAERRLPQDGRQSIRVGGQEVDLRVSTLPGAYGESVVIRLLRKKAQLPDIEGLGLEGETLDQFRSVISEPNGVVLVTGPTGSGKSTSLYRVIEEINNGERKIITIEDPVEYDIEGVTQVHARAEIGLSFAHGLRSMLRQDPDVIMVGEIRDSETALIAIQAALTGHLVLSTLHTNTALGSIERLIDLGVETFLIEAALKGVVGQRLLRRVCTRCARPAATPDIPRSALAAAKSLLPAGEAPRFVTAAGCEVCNMTGYRGRIGVFEILDMRRFARLALSKTLEPEEKRRALHAAGFRTMQEDGLIKAARGHTTLQEIERLLGRFDESRTDTAVAAQ